MPRGKKKTEEAAAQTAVAEDDFAGVSSEMLLEDDEEQKQPEEEQPEEEQPEEEQSEEEKKKPRRARKLQSKSEAETEEEKPIKKRGRKAVSSEEKLIRSILKKAGLEEAPKLETLVQSVSGSKMMKLKDIAVFLKVPDKAEEKDVLGKLAMAWGKENDVNLSTEVNLKQVKKNAIDILSTGRMYYLPDVAHVKKVKYPLQCVSGRHRLVFIALFYGLDVEVPVIYEEMTLTQAREKAVFANNTRRTPALEKAEHMVLRAVEGDVEADRDQMYLKSVTSKGKAVDFAVFSVMDGNLRGGRLEFPVSQTSSRKEAYTTITNLKGFWKHAIQWTREMTRKEFDVELKESNVFLNYMVNQLEDDKKFEKDQHFSAMALTALGKLYRTFKDADREPLKLVETIAEKLLGQHGIGRKKSEEIYNSLVQGMKRAAS